MGISAKEAAELASVSKGAILRAIKSGRMSATKDVNGEWEIDVAELSRVYTVRAPSEREDTPEYTPGAQREIELLREMLRDKGEVIEDLRRRLDAESDERRRLTALLEAMAPPKPRKAGWWQRLLGGGE